MKKCQINDRVFTYESLPEVTTLQGRFELMWSFWHKYMIYTCIILPLKLNFGRIVSPVIIYLYVLICTYCFREHPPCYIINIIINIKFLVILCKNNISADSANRRVFLQENFTSFKKLNTLITTKF